MPDKRLWLNIVLRSALGDWLSEGHEAATGAILERGGNCFEARSLFKLSEAFIAVNSMNASVGN
jgi:hypothetical protein